ncbi:MAG: RagB/SusD family nutrient uptake outer membrane protein [Gemmatimonadaceae bacterium]
MTTNKLQSVRRVGLALLLVPALVIGESCTSLTEVPHDALTPDNAFKTEAELLAGVAAVYAQLRSMDQEAGGGYVTMQDITGDVMIVPTRGSDWFDNGTWLEIHRQTWTANSGTALGYMNYAWNNLFAGVAKANLMIDVVTKAGGPNAPKTLAELRTLRAWYYYMLQDMFGGAPPLVTTTELKKYPSSTRAELFAFLETELAEAIVDLPATRPAAEYGRVTKSVAQAILASVYLNAGVFGKNTGVNATAYNSCMGVNASVAPAGRTGCQAAIDAADAVINSGLYSLNPVWKDNFDGNNNDSPENIFVIVYTAEGSSGLGGNWPMRTLHYNQLSTGWGSPWNGFATLAETYNAFDAADERRGMWLQGQAFSFETSQPVNDRTGNPLIFTVAIPDATQANEAHGVRFNKFPPIPSAATGNGHPNDFPFFRLAEMYLIKAEALNEQGNQAGAIIELRRVHDLRNPNPIAGGLDQAQLRDAILRERLLEFAGEGKRRTDLIRHGKFTSWTEASLNGVCGPTGVCGAPRAAHLILFPVPVTQIGSNPNLVQNPGY